MLQLKLIKKDAMRIIVIVFMFLTICSICMYSQHAVLEIEELSVTNVTVSLNNDIFEEESDGPYVNLKCELINRGRNDFIIYPSKSDIYITFDCEGVEYKSDVEAMPFTDKEVQVVKSQQVVNFRVGAYLLLGTLCGLKISLIIQMFYCLFYQQ
jgi:hypothetical protein